ncbi:hypothetical protein KRR23_27495 [Pseudomonas sp. CVAP|uniref:hypothetical protein n=1 Tax=Pseudomonas sp. CVAP\|nr:hypothetical protein [Pseudomonas sp. CVAP\
MSALRDKGGSHDKTWGPDEDGVVTFKVLGDEGVTYPRPLTGAMLQADGKLIVTSTVERTDDLILMFVMARLTVKGELDPLFGDCGLITGQFAPGFHAGGGKLASSRDGRIYMAGWTISSQTQRQHVAILCVDQQGERIEDFGVDGQVIVDQPTDNYYPQDPCFIQALPDGNLIVGTNYEVGVGRVKTAVLFKYDAKGNPVNSFGTLGRVEIKMADRTQPTSLNDCCILDNGRILVAGSARLPRMPQTYGLLAMLNENGSPNLLFGDSQTPSMLLITRRFTDVHFNAVKERAPNRFLAAGFIDHSKPHRHSGILFGFDDGGQFDPEFNNGDFLEDNLRPDSFDSWESLYVDRNSTIMVAGGIDGGYIAAYRLDGTLDPDFGNGIGYIEEPNAGQSAPFLLIPCPPDKILYCLNGIGIFGNLGHLYRYHR